MSIGTNKERIEQNNTLLEDIKTQIQNLPEAGSSGGIKQFSTVEEMQADTTAQEGDLAVVYRSEMKSIKDGDVITSITFPKTVVFDTAITSEYYSMLQNSVEPNIYLDMTLNSTGFSLYDMNSIVSNIAYSSADGITYTRTDTNADTYEIGETTISGVNEYICKFMQVSASIFEGLYEYGSDWSLAPTQLSVTPEYVYEKEFYGNNGVETGTLQNKENLTKDEVKHRVDIWSNYNSGIVCPSSASSMFKGCKNLTTIPLLDTSSVTSMNSMFYNCTNLTTIPLLNTSSVTNMGSMFNGCANLTEIPLLDTSSVTDMNSMFSGCKNLTTIPLLNTSSVTSMTLMFSYCTNLTEIPLLDTSSVTDMYSMVGGCTNLTTIPLLDTSSVTNMGNMFYYCTNLTTIPLLDTSSVTGMYFMFSGCTNLTEIPQLDTSSVTSMSSMFKDCTNLTTIPLLDTSSVTSMYNMFSGCTSLSDESLNNILAMCTNATHADKKTLKRISLTSEQAAKCTTLSNYSAFIAAGWTTGY